MDDRRRRLQHNPGELEVVPGRGWARANAPAALPRYQALVLPRRAWTDEEIRRVIEADPGRDTVQGLAAELNRTEEAIRIRRRMMVQLLMEEGVWHRRALAWREDPRQAAGFGDVGAVDRVLREAGWYALPAGEQVRRAKTLKTRQVD